MDNFLQLAQNRFSVRSFKQQAIEEEKINQILQAGRVAPTACNYQPQRVFVIQSQQGLEKIRKCTKSHFNAPVVLMIGYDKNECWKRSFDGKASGDIDASIVTAHMMLEAFQLGIGSTWVMHFDPAIVNQEFGFDDSIEITALLPIGYPSETAEPIALHFNKKELKDTVKFM